MSNLLVAHTRPRRSWLAAILPGFMFIAAGTLIAGRNDAIAISSTAVSDYVRPVGIDGRLVPQTYVFMEGQYVSSPTADRSLERATFADITRVLAINLVAQEYYPTKDLGAADLIIRVLWGATTIYEDPQRDQNIEAMNAAIAGAQQVEEGGFVDVGGIKSLLSEGNLERNNVEAAIARNAALLGYRRSLDRVSGKFTPDPEEVLLRTELNEERYFVVLLAYDYQVMRREKKPKLLWITRLSIRGPGNNFTEALPALALAGAQAYGRELADLERIKVRDLPDGKVTLGDLKVLGVAEPANEPKQDK